VLSYRRYFVNRNFPFVWTGFTLLTVTAMLGLWALHCVIDLSLLDFRNAVIRAALTIAIFPLASFMLGRAQRATMGAG
jgi:rod shape-determining protein MreD